ncbi:MAG: hypothetical protein HQ513_04910 [Rhodospirillales bacterium]|nr:hypothetical protein [Rhodospirillales bacterium]
MSLFEKSILLADGAGIVAFCVALLVLYRWRAKLTNPGLFFLVWAAAWLFEYYFLGENSYIHMDDEGDHFVPYYLNLINNHLGGQFGHQFAGGNDIYSAFSPGIQLISPELVWLEYLPLWLAILLHKALVVSVGFWGAYLLCRKVTKADVFTSAALGAVFTVSTHNLIYITYSIGSSLTFLPMAIWVFVARSDDRHYWRYAIPFAIVLALYLDPTHVVEPMFAGLGLAAVMLWKINIRVVASLVILLAFELINWGEPIYSLFVMSPLTQRGGIVDLSSVSVDRFYAVVQSMIGRVAENRSAYLAFGALAILWLKRDAMRWRWTLGILGIFVLFVVVSLFPFHQFGLAAISKLSHQYVLLSVTALMLLPLARVAEIPFFPKGWKIASWHNAGSSIILALAIGMLVHFKVYNFSNLLYHGGQSQYQSIANLGATDWRPKEPFRVITLRVRDLGPEPAIAYGLYGLESFDVYQMLESEKRSVYYEAGIMKQGLTTGGADPRLLVEWSRWQNGIYRGIGEQVSLNLLRIANVSNIISPLPIEENGIQLLAAPDQPPMTKFDRSSNMAGYLKDRVARLFDFPEMYIYAIPDAYPQLYTADRVVYVSDEVSDVDFIKAVDGETAGPGRVIVTRQKARQTLGQTSASLSVKSFAQIKNGYRAQISAPDGGVVVVNTTALPFWRASADGISLPIVAVNQIQLAVRVPAGAERIVFQYSRPTLKGALKGVFQ